MPSDVLNRDGSWRVYLNHPLAGPKGEVEYIEITPPNFSHAIRWGEESIPSTLALLSELSGQSESLLRQLKYPDVERVMLAFMNILPSVIRKDFEKGGRPLSTPREELKDLGADQVDPRFPQHEGPLQRFQQPPQVKVPGEEGGIADLMPDAFKKVG
jgi:hypothetical protein